MKKLLALFLVCGFLLISSGNQGLIIGDSTTSHLPETHPGLAINSFAIEYALFIAVTVSLQVIYHHVTESEYLSLYTSTEPTIDQLLSQDYDPKDFAQFDMK